MPMQMRQREGVTPLLLHVARALLLAPQAGIAMELMGRARGEPDSRPCCVPGVSGVTPCVAATACCTLGLALLVAAR